MVSSSREKTMDSETSLRALTSKKRKGRRHRALVTPGKSFTKKHVALLNALCHADSRQRNALVRTADHALIKCICECALNVLHGVVPLRDSEKSKLKRHRVILRKLIANTRGGSDAARWKSKKRAIVQHGGSFLPLLLAPLISTVFSKIFDK